ncbi:MAG: hypothetical protein GY854_24090 [Deltaproteobacteria bacterium]|nr:hypothetical protein [Deltaproteobacteria bacterium]
MKRRKTIPNWFVGLVVVLTAGVTGWAMINNPSDPDWFPPSAYPVQQMPDVMIPVKTVIDNSTQQVAGARPIPTIRAGALPPHGERGICTGCHVVVSGRGMPIPMIASTSVMPHQYRGLCSNCHQVSNPMNLPATNNQQAAMAFAAAGTPQPLAPSQPNAVQPPPAEGEWLGLEVAPITPLTAKQYSVPPEVGGLIVAEAEAQAAAGGVKAGDVVLSINGAPINDMTGFLRATHNGALTKGYIELYRNGQRLDFRLSQTTAATPSPMPTQPANSPAGAAAPAAMNAPLQQAPCVPGGGYAPGAGMGYGPAMGRGVR